MSSRDLYRPIRDEYYLAGGPEALLHIGDPLGVGGGVNCNTVQIKFILTHVINVMAILSMLCWNTGRHVGPSAILSCTGVS